MRRKKGTIQTPNRLKQCAFIVHLDQKCDKWIKDQTKINHIPTKKEFYEKINVSQSTIHHAHGSKTMKWPTIEYICKEQGYNLAEMLKVDGAVFAFLWKSHPHKRDLVFSLILLVLAFIASISMFFRQDMYLYTMTGILFTLILDFNVDLEGDGLLASLSRRTKKEVIIVNI